MDTQPVEVERLLTDARRFAATHSRIPVATYRLQMHQGFTLQDALQIVPYLDSLGISHLYLSSILTARPGSLHGYDVMDHTMLNPELGTEADLSALSAELRRRGMGLILDVVPNHMWVGDGNSWWMDVLENGPSSRYAGYFDIAWRNHPREKLRGKVLLPILGEPYGTVLQAGRISPFYKEGAFGLSIDQLRLPLDPRTYGCFIELALEQLRQSSTEQPANEQTLHEPMADQIELQSILSAVKHLPARDESDVARIEEGRGEIFVIKRRLNELTANSPEVAAAIDSAVNHVAESRGATDDATQLIDLLDGQAYRPCFWRVALDEINYRRFFDVNDLGALATEHEDVFQAVHQKPLEWLREGKIEGLRIDHVDGLFDPHEYLSRLQQYYLLSCAFQVWKESTHKYGADDWNRLEPELRQKLQDLALEQEIPLYVVVEKILGQKEPLPKAWTCSGTTGYEALNEINWLFVDDRQKAALTRIYQEFSHRVDDFEDIAYERKLQILRTTMASELHVLAHRLDQLAQEQWWSRDFTLNGLRAALEELIACFPVYRTYVAQEVTTGDRATIMRAIRKARRMSPLLGKEIFDFIADTLLLREPVSASVSAEYREQQRRFAMKFQQITSPVMAKGVEDTALYIYYRLTSLNEVGGEPAQFGKSPAEVHTYFAGRSRADRGGLTPLSTHDTKRGEDLRARINVLSELPELWEQSLCRWSAGNRRLKVELEDGLPAPDCNDEYLIYQTLFAVWPDQSAGDEVPAGLVERLQQYLTKACREAKVHTSWIYPNEEYDQGVSKFIAAILDPQQAAEFLNDLANTVRRLAPFGRLNTLSQTFLRCTLPGVPDTYQGTETWDDSLVDPDNRRPVNYELRKQLLESLDQLEDHDGNPQTSDFSDLLWRAEAKLWVTAKSLRFRREFAAIFQTGEYVPLEPVGDDSRHLFAFMLVRDDEAVLVAVPRLIAGQVEGDPERFHQFASQLRAEIKLPDGFACAKICNAFAETTIDANDGRLTAGDLLRNAPVALLHLQVR